MNDLQLRTGVHYVHDPHGNRYRIGECDRDVLGRSRATVLVAAFAAMLAVGTLQYGYGAVLPTLARGDGWRLATLCWVFAVWVVCQAAVGVAVATLRRRGARAPRAATLLGAVLCAGGLAALAHGSSVLVLVAGYGIAGGVGTGLVYASCLGVVAGWYPERPARAGLVSGAFCYGAVPLVLVLGEATDAALPLDLAALAVLVLAGGAALLLRDAPRDWWPAQPDPHRWTSDRSLNPALRRNRPALRVHSAGELLRLPAARLLYLAVACVSAVALFDLAYLAAFARHSGVSASMATAAVAVFAAGAGLVRGVAVRAGSHAGYRPTVLAALLLLAVAQLTVLGAGAHGAAPLLLAAAGVAGLGTGTCYALLPRLVTGYFGEHPGLPNFGLLYTAKAVGGVVGVGLATLLVVPGGYVAGLVVTAGVAVLAALSLRAVRRPSRLRLIPA